MRVKGKSNRLQRVKIGLISSWLLVDVSWCTGSKSLSQNFNTSASSLVQFGHYQSVQLQKARRHYLHHLNFFLCASEALSSKLCYWFLFLFAFCHYQSIQLQKARRHYLHHLNMSVICTSEAFSSKFNYWFLFPCAVWPLPVHTAAEGKKALSPPSENLCST